MFVFLASGKPFKFEFRVAEVDEKTNFEAGGVKVIDYLSLMLGEQCFDCFEFNQHFSLHQEICVEVADILRAKSDSDRSLGLRRKPRLRESDQKRFLVNGFNKPATKFVDNFEGAADDLLGEFSELKLFILSIVCIHVKKFHC